MWFREVSSYPSLDMKAYELWITNHFYDCICFRFELKGRSSIGLHCWWSQQGPKHYHPPLMFLLLSCLLFSQFNQLLLSFPLGSPSLQLLPQSSLSNQSSLCWNLLFPLQRRNLCWLVARAQLCQMDQGMKMVGHLSPQPRHLALRCHLLIQALLKLLSVLLWSHHSPNLWWRWRLVSFLLWTFFDGTNLMASWLQWWLMENYTGC